MVDAIVVQGLGKKYRRYRDDRPQTLKETLLTNLGRRQPAEYFWALRDISFRVASGQMVGIIGPNGAGKSTLLRLAGGVGSPDEGQVALHGRLGALLDLGAGFHPDLTGRENVFVNGAISGLTRQEIGRRFDSIVDFAELEEFIDSPLRTYSTGMQMRLGFSVAVHADPEILLIDEILAVGDLAFQRKCLDRIDDFRSQGCTILLVSHDMHSVQQLCNVALWLRRGKLAAYGPADVVVDQYVSEMSTETRRRTPATKPVVRTAAGFELRPGENRLGTMEMEITGVRLLGPHGLPVTTLTSGDPLSVEIKYSTPQPIQSPIYAVTISLEDGSVCYDTSTEAMGVELSSIEGVGLITLQIERLDLIGGSYYVDVGIYESNWGYAYDYHWHVYPLDIDSAGAGKGVMRPPARWVLGR
jgi:lipopolysaccharide transport system ATP-binding protein